MKYIQPGAIDESKMVLAFLVVLAREFSNGDRFLTIDKLLKLHCAQRRPLTRDIKFPDSGEVLSRFSSPHHCVPFFIQLDNLHCSCIVANGLLTSSKPVTEEGPSRNIKERGPFSAYHFITSGQSSSSFSLRK